jgi:hypothetical protein
LFASLWIDCSEIPEGVAEVLRVAEFSAPNGIESVGMDGSGVRVKEEDGTVQVFKPGSMTYLASDL